MEALHELNLFENKAAGIPRIYKEASLSNRRALLAGIIDSDGTLDSFRYLLNQYHGHSKIVEDFKEVATSCGINTSKLYSAPGKSADSEKNTCVSISGPGLDHLQEFIKLERKQKLETDLLMVHDRSSFKLEAMSDTNIQGRSLTVEGGIFRLSNGCFMHDSSKN